MTASWTIETMRPTLRPPGYFNQDEYSRESFAAEFNEILTERVGENWREHKVNTPIKEKALLVVYEAWIQGLDQLHQNELLAEG